MEKHGQHTREEGKKARVGREREQIKIQARNLRGNHATQGLPWPHGQEAGKSELLGTQEGASFSS